MFRNKIIALLLGLSAAGCATTGGLVLAQYLGSHITLAIDKNIPFPDELSLEGFEEGEVGQLGSFANEILGRMTGASLNRRVSDMIAKNSESHRETLVSAFKKELIKKAVFGAVVDEGGDVGLKLRVERYGLKAIQGDFSEIKPILELRATLVVPGIGNIWENSFNVPEYTNGLKKASLDFILGGNKGFEQLFESAAKEASEELVRRMH